MARGGAPAGAAGAPSRGIKPWDGAQGFEGTLCMSLEPSSNVVVIPMEDTFDMASARYPGAPGRDDAALGLCLPRGSGELALALRSSSGYQFSLCQIDNVSL